MSVFAYLKYILNMVWIEQVTVVDSETQSHQSTDVRS